jgi:hypothetical protein
VGELLDGAFTAIRRYPRATLGLAAMVMFVVETVQVLLGYWLLRGLPDTGSDLTDAQVGDVFARVGAYTLVGVLVSGLAVLVLTGTVTAVVGDGVLGRPVTMTQAWGRLRPVFGRLIGVSLLTFLIVTGVLLVGAVPGIVVAVAAGGGAGSAALLVLGLLAASVLAAYVWVLLALAPATVVLEKQPVLGALRRSRELVRGSWWRTFGILLLAGLIATVVNGIITVPFSIAGSGINFLSARSGNNFSFFALLLSGVGGLLAGTVVRPFTAGVTALLYIDRRMRREALDVALVQASSSPQP